MKPSDFQFPFAYTPTDPRLVPGLYTGEALVTKVHDGDTFTCNSRNGVVKVRLSGVDAPEMDQAFGSQAKEFLKGLILHQKVYLKNCEIGSYKRLVSTPFILNQNICLKLIVAGLAWRYYKYTLAEYSKNYQEAQGTAFLFGRGLWSQNKPIAPWIWRKLSKDEKTLVLSQ